jgi:hypothetical protein
MTGFFEYLKSKGLTPTRKEFPMKMHALTDDQLRDLIINAIGYASISHKVNDFSPFNFLANSTLSGGGFPCAQMACRLKNIDKLARNAVLYADTVFLANPFDQYLHTETFTDYQRLDLARDIAIMYDAKPLFDEGIFQFSTSIFHVCEACNKKMVSASRRLQRKLAKVDLEILEMVWGQHKFSLKRYPDSTPYVQMEGNDDLLEHPIVFNLVNGEDHEILGKLKNIRPRKLALEEVISLGIAGNIVNPISDDLINQHLYSNFFSAHYLTNRTIDVKCLNQHRNKSSFAGNKLLSDALRHELPFVEGVDLRKLIQLRKKEGEAFQEYRSSFSAFLKNANKGYDLQQAFNDEIQPEINKMNQTIKTSKKLIVSDITKDLVIGSTFVSVGLFSHFLPSNIGQIVAGLGGVNYLSKFGDNVKKLATVESDVRSNKYYFLWKLQKHMS